MKEGAILELTKTKDGLSDCKVQKNPSVSVLEQWPSLQVILATVPGR